MRAVIYQVGYALKLVHAGGWLQSHEEPNQITLPARTRLVKDAFHLLANRSNGNSPQGSNLLERVAGKEAIGDLSLGGCKSIKSVENMIGIVDRLLWICNQEDKVSAGAASVRRRQGRSEELKRLEIAGTMQCEEARESPPSIGKRWVLPRPGRVCEAAL